MSLSPELEARAVEAMSDARRAERDLVAARIQARKDLRRAMRDPELWAIEMAYTDAAGNRTRRVVSPIRWVSGYKFLALCLCREQPQTFCFPRCEDVERKPEADYLMPVPIVELI